MADLPIENLLPKANHSVYSLVSMAATRALELSDGRRCLAENVSSEKITTMALEEIAQGKIVLKEVGLEIAPSEKKEESASQSEQKSE